MIQEVDYTLRDIAGYEGGFTPLSVRCPRCGLGPGARCQNIAKLCTERVRFFGAVDLFFRDMFPPADNLTRPEVESFARYFRNQYGTLPEVRALYSETRYNALSRHSLMSLMSLRDLHEWHDMQIREKLKGAA